ncbi:IncV family inclusion membrane protein [Candidatus Chlamydia sanziniae]|uniref:Inclusion membrane protein A n=1 Tax=Candidatus Chlamydia sanziniae TaxID=1806891 RepID=A0A1A9HTR7_9CHLA|nr:IncV family inclusion membrane protein [Candidatus Chlamydia sanziniae]ANH78235.1 Inclusion membrane protein A [Candidatus Chlamydia sanziniae]
MSQYPINPLYSPQRAASVPSEQPKTEGITQHLKTSSASRWNSFLTAPDRYPKLKYVYDICLIAIAIISIISILIATQGNGLLLYALIPGFIMGALGVTLLVSDIASTPKAKKIADIITALLLPIIVLGIAAVLIASAYFSAGGTALVFANPQFIMGFLTIGLFFLTLNKITLNYFRMEMLRKIQKKMESSAEPILATPKLKDKKKIDEEKKKDYASTAHRQQQNRIARRHARKKNVKHQTQALIHHGPKTDRDNAVIIQPPSSDSDTDTTETKIIRSGDSPQTNRHNFSSRRHSDPSSSSNFYPLDSSPSTHPGNFPTTTPFLSQPFERTGFQKRIRVTPSSRTSSSTKDSHQQKQQQEDNDTSEDDTNPFSEKNPKKEQEKKRNPSPKPYNPKLNPFHEDIKSDED